MIITSRDCGLAEWIKNQLFVTFALACQVEYYVIIHKIIVIVMAIVKYNKDFDVY